MYQKNVLCGHTFQMANKDVGQELWPQSWLWKRLYVVYSDRKKIHKTLLSKWPNLIDKNEVCSFFKHLY